MVNINLNCNTCGEPISLSQTFCNKCGKSINKNTISQHCGNCGNVVHYPNQNCSKCNNIVSLATYQYPPHVSKTSIWWFAFPVFFAIFGGVFSWAILRETDTKMANYNLFVGIGVTMMYLILFIMFIFQNSEFT